MTDIQKSIHQIQSELEQNVTLVAVSKTKPNEMIVDAYAGGQRHFGENKVQELALKSEELPKDIHWHMIGHLQTNKVKYIAPFVYLIHAVDSLKLLKEINKQAIKNNRVIDCLLQVHIAEEESKFGFDENSIHEAINRGSFENFSNVKIKGLMGMATFTEDDEQVSAEFKGLKKLFDSLKGMKQPGCFELKKLSMGMSGDYKIAVDCGSTMVRIGSTIFGGRNN